MTKDELATIDVILNGKPFEVRPRMMALRKTLEITEEVKSPRTGKQNDSFHLWLSQVAEEMDKHGVTVQNVVARIQKAEIRPTGDNLKEVLWRPYQIAATGKESSTKLTKAEIDRVYEGLNKFIGEHFELHIPFPSEEGKNNIRLNAMENIKKEDYPEYIEPTI
jgi:hypothetical protein